MSKIVKFCIFEKHGGICEKYNSYCHLGACPYEDMREFELVEIVIEDGDKENEYFLHDKRRF